MEVHVHHHDGIPEGSMLSVRAAHTRRQAPLEVGKPLRFPDEVSRCNELQVDVLAVLGRAKLLLQPGTGRYGVQLEPSTGGAQMTCDIEVRREHFCDVAPHVAPCLATRSDASQAPAPGSGGARGRLRSHQVAAEAQKSAHDYMDRHCLVQAVQAAMQATINERPVEPLLFIANRLVLAAAELKGASGKHACPEANAIGLAKSSGAFWRGPEELPRPVVEPPIMPIYPEQTPGASAPSPLSSQRTMASELRSEAETGSILGEEDEEKAAKFTAQWTLVQALASPVFSEAGAPGLRSGRLAECNPARPSPVVIQAVAPVPAVPEDNTAELDRLRIHMLKHFGLVVRRGTLEKNVSELLGDGAAEAPPDVTTPPDVTATSTTVSESAVPSPEILETLETLETPETLESLAGVSTSVCCVEPQALPNVAATVSESAMPTPEMPQTPETLETLDSPETLEALAGVSTTVCCEEPQAPSNVTATSKNISESAMPTPDMPETSETLETSQTPETLESLVGDSASVCRGKPQAPAPPTPAPGLAPWNPELRRELRRAVAEAAASDGGVLRAFCITAPDARPPERPPQNSSPEQLRTCLRRCLEGAIAKGDLDAIVSAMLGDSISSK